MHKNNNHLSQPQLNTYTIFKIRNDPRNCTFQFPASSLPRRTKPRWSKHGEDTVQQRLGMSKQLAKVRREKRPSGDGGDAPGAEGEGCRWLRRTFARGDEAGQGVDLREPPRESRELRRQRGGTGVMFGQQQSQRCVGAETSRSPTNPTSVTSAWAWLSRWVSFLSTIPF